MKPAGDTDMPFEIFTLRNLINFYLDLAGQEFPYDAIENKMLLIVATIGITVCWNLLLLIKQILKLSENNSFKIENTVDKTEV
jgi:hypothetical protein